MSYVEELSAKYGWPLIIHSRGYDAYLVNIQPLLHGEVAPIYRWPGGDCVADKDGAKKRPADEFHRLMSMVWANPRSLDDKCDLFRQQPVDWYKEIALHAMKSISHELGPDQFSHCRHDTAGWAAHQVTKAVFEEQDIFDPYSNREFLEEAEKLLPWYIKRYTEGA